MLAARYVVELFGRVPNVESAGRELCCRISWPRAKISSQLAASLNVDSVDRQLYCRDSWSRAETCCDIVHIGNVVEIKENLILEN